jgi:hypothetical protein
MMVMNFSWLLSQDANKVEVESFGKMKGVMRKILLAMVVILVNILRFR